MAVEYDFPVSYAYRYHEAFLNREHLPPIRDPYEEDMQRHMAEIDRRCREMKFGVRDEPPPERQEEKPKAKPKTKYTGPKI